MLTKNQLFFKFSPSKLLQPWWQYIMPAASDHSKCVCTLTVQTHPRLYCHVPLADMGIITKGRHKQQHLQCLSCCLTAAPQYAKCDASGFTTSAGSGTGRMPFQFDDGHQATAVNCCSWCTGVTILVVMYSEVTVHSCWSPGHGQQELMTFGWYVENCLIPTAICLRSSGYKPIYLRRREVLALTAFLNSRSQPIWHQHLVPYILVFINATLEQYAK